MERKVRDVMTRSVVYVDESTPFKQIVASLSLRGVSALPVIDANGAVVGVVSENDLLVKEEGSVPARRKLLHPERARNETHRLHGLVAKDFMTAPAVTIGPDESIPAAARRMTQRGVGRLPVVDASGRCVGMVTRRDLLAAYLRPDEEIHDELVHDLIPHRMSIDPSTLPVRVRDGVVTLEGRVECRSMIPLIRSLVAAVDGVVDVEVKTTFETDDTTHLWTESLWTGLQPARRSA